MLVVKFILNWDGLACPELSGEDVGVWVRTIISMIDGLHNLGNVSSVTSWGVLPGLEGRPIAAFTVSLDSEEAEESWVEILVHLQKHGFMQVWVPGEEAVVHVSMFEHDLGEGDGSLLTGKEVFYEVSIHSHTLRSSSSESHSSVASRTQRTRRLYEAQFHLLVDAVDEALEDEEWDADYLYLYVPIKGGLVESHEYKQYHVMRNGRETPGITRFVANKGFLVIDSVHGNLKPNAFRGGVTVLRRFSIHCYRMCGCRVVQRAREARLTTRGRISVPDFNEELCIEEGEGEIEGALLYMDFVHHYQQSWAYQLDQMEDDSDEDEDEEEEDDYVTTSRESSGTDDATDDEDGFGSPTTAASPHTPKAPTPYPRCLSGAQLTC